VSNPSVITLSLSAAQSTGIALAQTPGAAGALTLNGALVVAGVADLTTGITSNAPKARRVVMASTLNDSARTFTITGTDRNGNAQAETLTGLNGNSAYTALDFATVTDISVDGACTGSITAGTNNVGSTPWVLDNFLATFWALSVAGIIQSGAVTYSVEHTYDDPNKMSPSGEPTPQQWSMSASSLVPPKVWQHQLLSGISASAEGQYPNQPIMAHRATITAGQGVLALQSVQAGIN